MYCDPPYAPLSRTASFATTRPAAFTALDQRPGCRRRSWRRPSRSRLCCCRIRARRRSCPDLRRPGENRPACRSRVPARRAINSRAARRGPVDEIIVTNARARRLDERARSRMPRSPRREAQSQRPKNGFAAPLLAPRCAWTVIALSGRWALRASPMPRLPIPLPAPVGPASLRRRAKVAELADAPDLGSGTRKGMGVRVPPFAPFDSAVGSRRSALAQAELEAPTRPGSGSLAEVARRERGSPIELRALSMKTEFTDVTETQKTITIEIPTEVVDAEIDRVARATRSRRGSPASVPARCPPRSSSSASGTRSSTT